MCFNRTSSLITVLVLSLECAPLLAQAEPNWNFGRSMKVSRIQPIKNPAQANSTCGPYVIGTLLAAHGMKIDQPLYDDIFREVNADGKGTPLEDAAAHLRKHDFDAKAISDATVNDLFEQFNKSLPAIVVVQLDPGSTLAAIVYDYTTNIDGTIKDWFIEDNGYARGIYSHEDFARMWSLPHAKNFSNRCLLISPKSDSPPPGPLLAQNYTSAEGIIAANAAPALPPKVVSNHEEELKPTSKKPVYVAEARTLGMKVRSLGGKARALITSVETLKTIESKLPSVPNLVFAVLAFVTLFPLLFLAVYSLNGKWMKQ